MGYMPRSEASRKKASSRKVATRISPARTAAFHILLELGRSTSTHSDDLLQGEPVDQLSLQDRNLCMTLTMGVLRWQLFLDRQIHDLLTHKTKLDEPIRIALRLAAFQLIFLDRIPAHAAISDSVELTKRAGHKFASGLVNAVLRKLVTGVDHLKSEVDETAAHPPWMVERWAALFGMEQAKAICRYDQYPPAASVRLASPDAEMALAEEDVRLAPGVFLANARSVLSGDVANTEAVRDGMVRLQDEGSQLIAELLGGTGVPKSILDSCAAPGGKTAILAERYPESVVIASDVSAVRLAKMAAVFQKTQVLARIRARVGDASKVEADERFDLILCDVPCSGSGTLARNPEIKLRLTLEDILRQQERQIAILRASLRALEAGGRLVYSTCSLEPEENEQVVQAILEMNADYKLVPVRQRLEELRATGALHADGAVLLLKEAVHGEYLRVLPGKFATDGFFAAIFTRD